jgi:hypothetical protein
VTQLKALEVTPEFVEGFARIGYKNLPVDTLVQLKALDVTPAYVTSLRDRGLAELSPEQLVAMQAIGDHRGRRKCGLSSSRWSARVRPVALRRSALARGQNQSTLNAHRGISA